MAEHSFRGWSVWVALKPMDQTAALLEIATKFLAFLIFFFTQEDEEEGGDDDDDDDGFFVPHGYLSDDEGAQEEEV